MRLQTHLQMNANVSLWLLFVSTGNDLPTDNTLVSQWYVVAVYQSAPLDLFSPHYRLRSDRFIFNRVAQSIHNRCKWLERPEQVLTPGWWAKTRSFIQECWWLVCWCVVMQVSMWIMTLSIIGQDVTERRVNAENLAFRKTVNMGCAWVVLVIF